MAVILSISIDKELADFLESQKELSPSKIFQQRVQEIKEQEYNKSEKIKALQIRLTDIQTTQGHLWAFLKEKGLDIECKAKLREDGVLD